MGYGPLSVGSEAAPGGQVVIAGSVLPCLWARKHPSASSSLSFLDTGPGRSPGSSGGFVGWSVSVAILPSQPELCCVGLGVRVPEACLMAWPGARPPAAPLASVSHAGRLSGALACPVPSLPVYEISVLSVPAAGSSGSSSPYSSSSDLSSSMISSRNFPKSARLVQVFPC